ncbi:MAG TPA: hypothetical protein VKG25_24465 [Bryobacteraceae bacterium]|nr:hypothetical protein [Bryobacteraceae bacterium]
MDCHRLLSLCWWTVASPLHFLWWLSVASDWFALIQLTRYRMFRLYPALFTFVVAVAGSDFVFLFLNPNSADYRWPWLIVESGLLALKVLLVWELVRLVCGEYTGIGNFARILLIVSAAVAVSFCLLTVQPEVQSPHWSTRDLQLLLMITRWVATVLAGLVLLLSAFFSVYGHPGRRNLTLHRWVTTAYLAGNALIWFYGEFVRDRTLPTMLQLGLSTMCFVSWGMLMPAGETQKAPPPGIELDTAARWNAELIAVGRRVLGNGREGHSLLNKR